MIASPSLLGLHAAPGAGRRSFRRLLAAVAVAVVALLGLAPGAASAANTVVSSSPATGSSSSASPTDIIIIFAEDLADENTLTLSCDGDAITLDDPEVVEDTTLQVALAEALPRGTCTAVWAVTDAEGATTTGNINFVVENEAAPATAAGGSVPDPATTADAEGGTVPDAAGTTDPVDDASTPASNDPVVTDLSVAGSGDAAVWLARLISTLGIATLFGSLLFVAAAWPEGVEYLVTVKFLRVVWVVAALGTLLFVAFASAAVTPDGGGSPLSPGTWFDLVDAGWAGRAALLRLVLVIASAWAAFRPDRVIDPTTQLAALGLPALATVMLGISRTVGDLAPLGVLMGILHALAMAIWVGGVVLLARVVLAGPGDEDLIHAVRGFGRISTPAILVTIATGVVQTIRLDGGELFQSGHGRVLLLKTVVVAGMIFVAFSARQFVAQRLNREQKMSVALADRLRRAFGAEAAFGVVALALSSWLLAWTPPNVDAAPKVDYAITQTHSDASGVLDVVLKFTDDAVGNVGMQVEVRSPEEDLSGLSVVLTAPENPTLVGYRQVVPLDGPGYAVRSEAVGFPLTVAGDWIVTVEATTAGGPVSSTAQVFSVLSDDGEPGITVDPAATATSSTVNTIQVAPSIPTSEA